ncbi:MAG: KpsF/GutQ family sugar-phosphate isomerase [Gammaproteobacteria bacterium]|nr:KpsF/GutQ family sugar-phosphate isomerase [Gammaproteobacteria bacterium]
MAAASKKKYDEKQALATAREVLEIEAAAVAALGSRLADDFGAAVRLCLECSGRIVVTGLGKSGHVGGKIAATLASTGSPAFFVHAGEASHGDLGMITRSDVVLAISNSGETAEIIAILPLFKRLGVPVITITGNADSTLAKEADVNLDAGVSAEACPLNLAPTASTTASLAMGDALAITLLKLRGFTEEEFALSHPGGSLGRRLLLRVGDLMHRGEEIPRVGKDTVLSEALLEMTRKGLGMTAIVDEDSQILGIYTDGDLRRSLDGQIDVHRACVADVMTRGCKTIRSDELAAVAVNLMETHKISALLVVDENDRLAGAINIHDLLRAGVM